jgi:cysteine synthase A
MILPTPLVSIFLEPGSPPLWCKLEFLNPSGSTKDRVARYILEKAWRQGILKAGQGVVEASSGSTGIALALVTAQMGFRFIAVMPEGVSNERVVMIRAFGGEVVSVPNQVGISGAIEKAKTLAREKGYFFTNQFENPDNIEAHRFGTAQEILAQIPQGIVHAVVSGVGTGGTLVGLFSALKEQGCPVKPFAARPVNITQYGAEIECCSFGNKISGVVEGVSKLYSNKILPEAAEIEIDEEIALEMTRRLIRKGFPVGPSSGLNFAAALEVAKRLDSKSQIVTVFPDRMERYFSTGLLS